MRCRHRSKSQQQCPLCEVQTGLPARRDTVPCDELWLWSAAPVREFRTVMVLHDGHNITAYSGPLF